MSFTLTPELRSAIEAHARAEYPKESCGLIVSGAYEPCENIAADPLVDFLVSDEQLTAAYLKGALEAIVHSHPDGEAAPTASDMQGQLASRLPWIIVPLNDTTVAEPVIWGDGVEIPPVIGRQFRHGVTDCYSLIRDVFRLGREELAKQDVDWPLPPIELPEFPRDDAWWAEDDQNLYVENFAKAGFVEVKREEARPGDVFLSRIRSSKLNHGGVVVGGGLILHHLPLRLSMREPASIWARAADMWLRHKASAEALDAS